MDIEFNCNKCGQHIVIDGAGAGEGVQCPKCGQSLTVPQAQPDQPRPTTPGYIPPVISKPITQKRKGRTGLIVGLGVAALLILLFVLMTSTGNSPSKTEDQDKAADPQAYIIGYGAGSADAVYPADALTHSDAERESLARKIASENYHIESGQVDQWVESFKIGYATGYKEYNDPSSRAHTLGMAAGMEMCQQGAVKPSDEVLDAMARRAVGTGDSYMWKTGFRQGWSSAHGL